MSPFATLTTTLGWVVVRACNYGGAVGDPHRWPEPSQIYRASGLSPAQNAAAGKRRDGSISRGDNVALRRAPVDLGMGPSMIRPAGYAATLKAKGKKGGVISCALANRATRIAYAMVRDQTRIRPRPLGLRNALASPVSGQSRPRRAERSRWTPAAQRGLTTLTAPSRGTSSAQPGKVTPKTVP
jgi:hypothetical protein